MTKTAKTTETTETRGEMMVYYLAVDIGASSGRHILGWMEGKSLRLEEIYRFENGIVERDGQRCWDIERLVDEVIRGIARCKELGRIPCSVGVDTWGVDFVLLDRQGKRLGEAVSYRDSRTQGMDDAVRKLISDEELYQHTGIQKLIFNTLYQLYALRLQRPELLERAESFLMIPDYVNYRLTGVKKNEYTNATTTQLIHAVRRTWDMEIIERLGLPKRIFGEIFPPTTRVGGFTPAVRDAVGFDCEVVLPATHDTGSAVMAVPFGDEAIYLSSGTWSLMGVVRAEADCSEASRLANFTNEGGFGNRYRYLKNIMGLWMLQGLRKEFSKRYTFEQMAALASASCDFASRVDVNDGAFLAPPSMLEAVRTYCVRTGQGEPQTDGEFLACVYGSLADCYAATAREIERLTGRTYENICIVGGGSQDVYLNSRTAEATGKTVFAGPVEATAMGNILAQTFCR